MSSNHWPEIIAALLHKPRTVLELTEYTGAHEQTIARCLRGLHESGVVYRSGAVGSLDDGTTRAVGAKPVLWALQQKPFGKADVVGNRGGLL